MKAMAIEQFGGKDVLKLMELPTPEPQPNEVQISVAYAAVNPVDWKIREGLLQSRLPHEFPIILGWDVSGKISKVGKEVTDWKVGDEVFAYARKSFIHDGTFAEYVCLESKNVARRPKSLSLRDAAAIPLTALTAWQALVEWAQINKGESVLIHAGAGGVGGMGIQFAKNKGCKVFTTASAKNFDYVRKLGADVIIDYQKEDFVAKVKEFAKEGVDVVFDTMGNEILKSSFKVLKKGGRIVSIVQQIPPKLGVEYGVKVGHVFVRPDGEELRQIAEMIDADHLILPEITEYSFNKLPEALETVKEGHVRGKIVIKVQ